MSGVYKIAWRIVCALMLSASLAHAAPEDGPTTRPIRRRILNVPTSQPVVGNPIPGVAAQQQAAAKIHDIYAADYADTTFTGRRTLARRLIDASDDTKRDSDAKFVLLREARNLSAQVGDVTTAFEAIDHLSAAFPVAKLAQRVDVMQTAVPILTTPQANLAAVSICMDLVDQSIVEGDYDHADVLLNLAADAARRAKSKPYYDWVQSKAVAFEPLKSAYSVARPAEAALSRAPGDPQANLVMGKFTAFTKGDFDLGLAMLGKSSDRDLSKLANQDLDTPDASAQQLQTASAWWDMADAQPSDYRDAMRRRAGFWYKRAVDGLDGLDRALAERRLQELNPPPKTPIRIFHPPDALKLTAHWYRASIAEVSWDTAAKLCRQDGGQLLCVETRAEGDLMAKLARGRSLWLGASTDGNGRWKWLNDADFFYSNWAGGEPASFTIDSHPMIGLNGTWRSSSGKAGFICEWSQ